MRLKLFINIAIILTLLVPFSNQVWAQSGLTYKIVDTGQNSCYDTTAAITAPAAGSPFYGQDAQYNGYQPSYTNNGNGTITDNVTGLMWSQSLDLNNDGIIDTSDKLTYDEAIKQIQRSRN